MPKTWHGQVGVRVARLARVFVYVCVCACDSVCARAEALMNGAGPIQQKLNEDE